VTDPEIVARYLAGEHVKRLHDGVTNEPVYRALRKAGIAPNRTRARWPRIAELHAQGMHLCAIAREVGATPSVVSYALKAMAAAQPPAPSPSTDDWRTGYRTQEIKDAVERGE